MQCGHAHISKAVTCSAYYAKIKERKRKKRKKCFTGLQVCHFADAQTLILTVQVLHIAQKILTLYWSARLFTLVKLVSNAAQLAVILGGVTLLCDVACPCFANALLLAKVRLA